MGQAARQAALTRFHPELIVPQYLAAYARTITGDAQDRPATALRS